VPESIASPLIWVVFTAFVVSLLVLDLMIFHRKPHVIGLREAGLWTLGWVSLAALFNLFVFTWAGSERGLEFTAGYLVELALSVDNMFVFALIFTLFAVPPAFQHRVLFWGILGALVMRFTFILLGSALLHTFHWVMYVFGIFLIFTGIKILRQEDGHVDPSRNIALRIFRRFIPMVGEYRGPRFTVVEHGRRYATPLFAVLIMVEATDVVFAIDSVPAIFAVTNDPFIVFTSNVFAILGLRSLYFLLAGIMDKFRYLKYGLGLVLVAIGAKMTASDVYHVPVAVSLLVIVVLIGGSILVSLLRQPEEVPTLTAEATPPPDVLEALEGERSTEPDAVGAGSSRPTSRPHAYHSNEHGKD
jgi:tellurite resistance protein TerC